MGPRLTLLDAPRAAEEGCYIDTALGVASVLRAVAASGARAAAYFDSGKRFIHTTLLAVEDHPAMLVFEKGPDARLNADLLETPNVTFVTSDQGVPVQFSCPSPKSTRYGGTEAFHAPVPSRVLRLQRRDYYRLLGEPTHSCLRCELVPGNDDSEPMKAWVFDLSCGGLAAGVVASEPVLEQGTVHGCTLELPGEGRIQTRVEISAASETLLPHGLEGRRYGLGFVDLPEKSAARIQRYILEQQRLRKRG